MIKKLKAIISLYNSKRSSSYTTNNSCPQPCYNMSITKLSIIIPVYNEMNTITLILDKIKNVNLLNGILKEVIVINDCSTDESERVILDYILVNPEFNIRYKKQEVNRGKGAALHIGISKATGEFLIIQDADLEYDPEEYNDLLQPVLKGYADVVYGSRFRGGKSRRVLFFWHFVGNRFLTFLSNIFANIILSDMETCYKLFRTEIIQDIQLLENRFGFEPEVTAKISRVKNIRFYEIGISYYGRTYQEGKKIGWRDGFRAIYCILKYNLVNTKSQSYGGYQKNVRKIPSAISFSES
jgi:glycosyltransferase involved in cell wall biosynthesis